MTKKLSPAPSKRTKLTRAQLRDTFMDGMYRMIENRGFIQELFNMLDEVKDPAQKLRLALELLSFSLPKLASQKIEVENTDTPVTKIVFAPAPIAIVSPKPNS